MGWQEFTNAIRSGHRLSHWRKHEARPSYTRHCTFRQGAEFIDSSQAFESTNLEDLIEKLQIWAQSETLMARAIEVVREEAQGLPEITSVLKTRFGRNPTFIFLTSNKKYDPELDKRIFAIDNRLFAELPPPFRCTILCFPEMGRPTSDFVSGEHEMVYRKDGVLLALP